MSANAPLAVRMRPRTLDEVVGQEHLLRQGSPLRRLVEGSGAASVILYGPPGTGKTTLASLISGATGRRFEALSALSAGVKEVRAVIDSARRAAAYGEQTALFIDEVHRFSKTQQDALLAAVENRVVLLVAATTENPSFSVVAPLLSRSLILQLQPLSPDGIRAVVERATADPRGLGGKVVVDDDALDLLVRLGSGDARRALTALEVAAEAGDRVTVDIVEQSLDRAAVRYDRDGDHPLLGAGLPLHLGRPAPPAELGPARLGAEPGYRVIGHALGTELGRHDQRPAHAARRLGQAAYRPGGQVLRRRGHLLRHGHLRGPDDVHPLGERLGA